MTAQINPMTRRYLLPKPASFAINLNLHTYIIQQECSHVNYLLYTINKTKSRPHGRNSKFHLAAKDFLYEQHSDFWRVDAGAHH